MKTLDISMTFVKLLITFTEFIKLVTVWKTATKAIKLL